MTRRPQKKRITQAVLRRADIRAIRALELSPLERALFEWLYTNGARASEAGLAQRSDVDLRVNRVKLLHLKHGLAPNWNVLVPQCRQALAEWVKVRPEYNDARDDYIFPRSEPIGCYECDQTGKVLRYMRTRDKKKEQREVVCPLCRGSGSCYGLTRHDVRHIIVGIFKKAGIHEDFHFPHVLRHTAVTHLLERKFVPTDIQRRLGHQKVETTYGYMHTTEGAEKAMADAFADEEPEDE